MNTNQPRRYSLNSPATSEQEEESLEPQASPTIITFAVVMLMSASTTLSMISGDYTYSPEEGIEKISPSLEKVSPSKELAKPDVTTPPSQAISPSKEVPKPDVTTPPSQANLTPPSSTAVNTAQKITDTALLDGLEQQLFDSLDQTWTIPVSETSIYVVRVDETGAIIAYTPINSIAQDNLQNIPLPDLIQSNAPVDSGKPTVDFAEFEVIFSDSGTLEVQPHNPEEFKNKM
ncbi:hypothetical protein VB834_29030 [Limnoraphis robusta Tam1]|uniref:Uncharacterized protein n=1 Tax=Limnoraphis robusta CCNP1315 TaxID=3110306 RepID=A0ABU5TZU9_9CYAN|nr:hypothetical protein [Limnoraphis robusta]MEA5501192.1 hypothetical protein [Limnoraphis robusta BA-68 BA1]MEA5519403.1 hypothetical protein [Limnoraphis robusta CCNP1315]MEA5543080.1 hypothetical protein [Limnoraphis robusta Tam1]MEA5549141.1 hypothetical protein [Limnoraphis robusta CCNP1324]